MTPPIGTVPDRFRSSQRLTITVPYRVFQALQQCSACEGRSVSNLASHLLETCLEAGWAPQRVVRHGLPQDRGSAGVDPRGRAANAGAEEAATDLWTWPDAQS